jgi:predicted N-acetyltransferase YhbS
VIASTSTTTIRSATSADAEKCGRIFFDAFESIAARHGFPTEPGSPEFTRWKVASMLADEGFHGIVAERDGSVLGSLFIDERSPIVGIGPVTVDPGEQDAGIGRALMEHALQRSGERGAPGVRLVQTAYHYRSFALYASLGFVVREPLSVMQGQVPDAEPPAGHLVRPATPDDVEPASELCRHVHGHDRARELAGAVSDGTAVMVERGGEIAGYATGLGYGWHAVAEDNQSLISLLASAESYMGLGLLVPSRNAELLGWCLRHGLRVVQQSTLMTIGLYNEPRGAYLPSIVF